MKSSVAFFLALIIFTSGPIWGQTPSRKGNQGAVTNPRNDTLKICQGVPIPDGYVIIAYMTSGACPHGAYLLKKQSDYENNLAVSGNARQPAQPANGTANNNSSAAVKSSGSGTAAPAARRTGTSAKTNSSTTQPVNSGASSTATGTRPRRIGAGNQPAISPQTATQSQVASSPPQQVASAAQQIAQSNDVAEPPAGPPTLIGSQPSRPSRPPTLGTMGAQPATSPGAEPANKAAQEGPEEVDENDVLRVDTSLVTVPVSVLDRQGRFISNLQKEDFRVFENGVEQSIAYFEPAEKPFTVALVLDTSASTHFHLQDIREAAIAFAKQLRPQDRVLIVSFNDEVLLLTEATNDMNLIETVIEENANTGNSTRLYDAVDLTIRERLNKIKGRKAIVLFTDGVDTSSQQATYDTTLREVDELDALIYPVQYDTSDYLNAMQGLGNGTVTVTTTRRGIFGTSTTTQTYGQPAIGSSSIPGTTKADYDRADRYLHLLADKTGGRLYQANDTRQLAQAFTQIAEELRRQYSLGYYPKTDAAAGADSRRQIRVKVKQGNLAVKARDSYMKSVGQK